MLETYGLCEIPVEKPLKFHTRQQIFHILVEFRQLEILTWKIIIQMMVICAKLVIVQSELV
jgi:hypothetical protein